MSSLFDKFSTLVNAQVNDLLGRNPSSPLARIRLNPEAAEKDPRRSAQALRQRMDEALDYENDLQGKIDGLAREALELDAAVDECLERGDQVDARRWQAQLNIKRQQLTIAESDLREHRMVTRHLMQEIAVLESALDSRENQQRRQEAGGGSAAKRRIPVEGGSAASSFADGVADKLNEARDSIETLLNRAPPTERKVGGRAEERIVIVDEAPDPRQPKARQNDQDTMKRRLSRLSKPAEDES